MVRGGARRRGDRAREAKAVEVVDEVDEAAGARARPPRSQQGGGHDDRRHSVGRAHLACVPCALRAPIFLAQVELLLMLGRCLT
jgi:hypothetical protein